MRVFVQWRLQLVAAMHQVISAIAIAKGILMASMTAISRKLRTEFVRQDMKNARRGFRRTTAAF